MRTRPIRFSSDPVPSHKRRRSKKGRVTEHQPDDKVKMSSGNMSRGHISVLLHEAISLLDIREDDIAIDATLGGAGHAKAIAQMLGPKGIFIGFDLDHTAIERAKVALEGTKPQIHLIEGNFRAMRSALVARDMPLATKILFDLGWSSYQLDAGKGFSFQKDEPLLMTYGNAEGQLTAREIVNRWEEESISDIIFGWGEERYARKIAKAIVLHREKKPIETAGELADVIKSAVPPSYRHGRIHPATRTFQALRIAVNDELGSLEEGLEDAWQSLQIGGRIAVITFHSLEDRIVKRAFLEKVKAGEGRLIVKKPVVPTSSELASNPRARSAKLRVIEKVS